MDPSRPTKVPPVSRYGLGRPPSPLPGGKFEQWLFDAATILAVTGVTAAIGGRHPAGQSLLTCAAILAVFSWLVRSWMSGRETIRAGTADALMLTGLAVTFIQIVPLPPAMVDAISPQLADLLPRYSEGSGENMRWSTISLVPEETLAGLMILFAQAAYIWVLTQRVHGPDDLARFLRVVAGTTVCLSLVGIAQYLFGNGRFLWIYEPAFGSAGGVVKGTFTNRNHFAGFLAIGFSAVAWWTLADGVRTTGRRHRHSHRPAPPQRASEPRLSLGLAAMATVAFATALSLSRGGTLALILSAVTTTGLFVWSGHVGMRTAIGLLIAAGILGVALTIHGSDDVGNRLATLLDEQELAEGFSRLEVWKAAIRSIGGFPWLGTGVGTHADVSPISMPPTGGLVFTHAESSYLTLGVESGIPGLLLACMTILLVFVSCFILAGSPSHRERGIAAAGAGMLAAGAGHAVGDFTWYAPAISTLLLAMGASIVRLASERSPSMPSVRFSLGRMSSVVAASGVVSLLMASAILQAAAVRSEPVWERSIKQSLALADHGNDLLATEAERAVSTVAGEVVATAVSIRTPAADAGLTDSITAPEAIAAERRALLLALDDRIASLEEVVTIRPAHPHAWAELAVARLERFGLRRLVAGESLTLLDLRQTVQDGRFAGHDEAVNWVARVTGDGFADLARALAAARRAVHMTPCAGDAWCVLAVLGFLDSFDPALSRNRIVQATLVRPHHPLVLFEAAIQASIDGDEARTTDLLRRSFAASSAQRNRIISLLLPMASAAEVCELLQPDLSGLRRIDAAWSAKSSPEAMRPVRERRLALVVEEAERREGAPRGRLLREAAAIHGTLGDPAAAIGLLEKVVNESPFDSNARLQIADLSMAMGDLDAVAEQLDWCLLERPDSPAVKSRVERLRRMQLRAFEPNVLAPDRIGRMGGENR